MSTLRNDNRITKQTLDQFTMLLNATVRLGISVYPEDTSRLLEAARLTGKKGLSSKC